MNLKLTGVQKILNELQNLENDISREVDGELQAGVNKMARDAKTLAPSNFGEIRNSIGTEPAGKLRYSIFANAWHAPYVEFGTRGKVQIPGALSEIAQGIKNRKKRPQDNWDAFVSSILKWGTAKGYIKKGDKNHAENIAKRIYKNGISPQPFMWPAFVRNRKKLIDNIKAVVERKR